MKFSGTPGSSKKTTCSLSYRFRGTPGIRGLYQPIRVATLVLTGPVLRDTARLSQRYPPIARYGVCGVSTWPIGCDTPSLFSERFSLGEHAKCRCDTPPQKGYLSDIGAIPYENKANRCDTSLCDGISKRYCAIGGVSRTGPLSACSVLQNQGARRGSRTLRKDKNVCASFP